MVHIPTSCTGDVVQTQTPSKCDLSMPIRARLLPAMQHSGYHLCDEGHDDFAKICSNLPAISSQIPTVLQDAGS